jgi:ditrans,polycis-polyprenyl diphosphate synthase
MLEICMRLGVRCVSAYAFAIENWKRSPEEVNALMKLAEEKLVEMAQHGYVASLFARSVQEAAC